MPQLGLDFIVGGLVCRVIDIHSECEVPTSSNRYYEHNHSCLELHFVEAGSCDYICDKKIYRVGAGQVILIPPRMYHHETNTSDDFKKLSILFDISTPKKDADASDVYFHAAFFFDKVKIIAVDNAMLLAALTRIRSFMYRTSEDYICLERLRTACNLFLVELFAQITGGVAVKNQKSTKGELSQEYIIDVFIAQQFMPKASVSELASQLHVSERQLYRMITQKYGMNYRDKIKEIRVEVATNFLVNTDKSVTEIAELMGYSSVSAFSTFIKNATGKTPKQIRKSRE